MEKKLSIISCLFLSMFISRGMAVDLKQLKDQQPLRLVEAKWGAAKSWKTVTSQLQKAIDEKCGGASALSWYLGNDNVGKTGGDGIAPASWQKKLFGSYFWGTKKTLKVKYQIYGVEQQEVSVSQGKPLNVAATNTTEIETTKKTLGTSGFTFYAALSPECAWYNDLWSLPAEALGVIEFKAKPEGDSGFCIQLRNVETDQFTQRDASTFPQVTTSKDPAALIKETFLQATRISNLKNDQCLYNKKGGLYYLLEFNKDGVTLTSYCSKKDEATTQMDWMRNTKVEPAATNLKTTTGTEESWWIIVSNTIIVVGKGTEVGKGEKHKFVVPDAYKIDKIKLFGLGGFNNNVTYSGIKASVISEKLDLPELKAESIETQISILTAPLNLSNDFRQDTGTSLDLESVVMGCNEKGLPVAYVIDATDKIYFFDAYSFDLSPWVEISAKDTKGKEVNKVLDVACSQKGDLIIVKQDGKISHYDLKKGTWKDLTAPILKDIVTLAISDKKVEDAEIFAIAGKVPNTFIYKLTKDKTWDKMEGTLGALSLSIGLDGHIMAVNNDYVIVKYEEALNGWRDLSNVSQAKFIHVSCGSKDQAIAIANDYSLWKWNGKSFELLKGQENKPFSGFVDASINAGGWIGGITGEGHFYYNDSKGIAIDKKETRTQAQDKGKVKSKKAKTGTKTKISKKGKAAKAKAAKVKKAKATKATKAKAAKAKKAADAKTKATKAKAAKVKKAKATKTAKAKKAKAAKKAASTAKKSETTEE